MMDAAILEVDEGTARREFLRYLSAVKEQGNSDDRLICDVYRELSRGRRVLNLYESMQKIGCKEDGTPRIAICRADAEFCWLNFHNGSVQFRPSQDADTKKSGMIAVPQERYLPGFRWKWNCRAVVPRIPPKFRPPDEQLCRYHILWDAVWQRVAPKDPLLLKHIRGPFYVVLAQWDLTDVERAVLGLRA